MLLKPRTPKYSAVEMNEIVLPEHTNLLNQLMGGRLMCWMDVCSFIVAQRHANRAVVTASVDHISFKQPIPLGNIVRIRGKITRAFHSSMEIFMEVRAENTLSGEFMDSNSAFFTFVALDQTGRPTQVPGVRPESEEERIFFDGALRRRRLRLLFKDLKDEKISELLGEKIPKS